MESRSIDVGGHDVPLPVPADMMRVRMRATLWESGTELEEAQFGFYGQRFHRTGNVVDWPANVQEVANKVRDKWNSNVPYKAGFPGDVHMDSVTVNHLEAATGKTLDQGVALFTGDDAWVGTGPKSLPWETALCVSLSGYQRGSFVVDKARKRGRFYLPPMSSGVLNDVGGEIDSTALGYIATQIIAFLNDVQGMTIGGDEVGGDQDYFNLVVMSIGTPAKPLTPATFPVTNIYVDSKFDSQRRRERQQGAAHTVTGVIDHSD